MTKLPTDGVYTFERDEINDVSDELVQALEDNRIGSKAVGAAVGLTRIAAAMMDDEDPSLDELEPILTVTVEDDEITGVKLEDNLGILNINASKYRR